MRFLLFLMSAGAAFQGYTLYSSASNVLQQTVPMLWFVIASVLFGAGAIVEAIVISSKERE